MEVETQEEELFRLIIESNAINERVQTLLVAGTQLEKKEENEWVG